MARLEIFGRGREKTENTPGYEEPDRPAEAVTLAEISRDMHQWSLIHKAAFSSDNPNLLQVNQIKLNAVVDALEVRCNKYMIEGTESVGEIVLFQNVSRKEVEKKGLLKPKTKFFDGAQWEKVQNIVKTFEENGIVFKLRWEDFPARPFMTVFFDVFKDSRA